MENVNQVFLISGALAGIVSRLGTHPLDSCKIILQSNAGKSALLQMFKNGGILGLYQGVGISILLTAPGQASYLALYEISKHKLNRAGWIGSNTFPVHFASAIIAEAVSGIFWTPMDLIKQKLQTNQSKSTRTIIQSIYATGGLKGFWRGYGITLLVFMPFSGTYFVSYEKCKKIFASTTGCSPDRLPMIYVCVSSTLAGILGSLVANPFDVVKTRYQLQAAGNNQSVLQVMQSVYQSGIGTFGRGVVARMLWMAPQVVISMTCFEYFKQSLRQNE